MDYDRTERLVRELLVEMGEDPGREGLRRTPHRVARALEFLTSGYRADLKKIINGAVFQKESSNMVVARDIEVYSLCEHHLLPFYGRCHVGYIPKARVLGVSKLARLVDCYARRLQIQERLTAQIAAEIHGALEGYGVGVVMECRHLCMMMRGVEKQNSVAITSSMLGSFRANVETRMEFMDLIKGKRN